ncbi:hypothetical protein IV203_020794 [Nitzschia inconspicua]|uniref:Uncharacterized protein n=1 Tax=Nitzschia inconspicua TaxID=303405 RepID=A0A9K3PDD1_9STRA|nr:hypothetical protein IV203_020794 [Nitzschia inconspicua]
MASNLHQTPASTRDPPRIRPIAIQLHGPTPFSNDNTPSRHTLQQSTMLMKPSRKFYLDMTVGLAILVHLLETTLHVMVAIFGIGVGVGLILGDSFRASPSSSSVPAGLVHSHTSNSHAGSSASWRRSVTNDNRPTTTTSTPFNSPPPEILNGLPAQ